MKTGHYPCCLMCNHCENIDLISETGICGPQEGETVYLYSPCCCDVDDIKLVESLQSERDAAAPPAAQKTTFPIRLTRRVSAVLPILASSPEEAVEEAQRLVSSNIDIWEDAALLPDVDEGQVTACSLATDVYIVPGKYHQSILDFIKKLNKVKGLNAKLALSNLAPAMKELCRRTSLEAIKATDERHNYVMLQRDIRSVVPPKEVISPFLVFSGWGRLVTKTISGHEDITPEGGDIFLLEIHSDSDEGAV